MRKHLKRFFTRWYVIFAIIIVAIVLLYILTHQAAAPVYDVSKAVVGNVIEKVSVTGKISPLDKADLAFQKGGAVAKIFVKVGDTVKKGDPIASLDSASDAANLQSAQAKLGDVSRNLRPEELQAEQSKVDSAKITLTNAKQDALNAVRNGYLQAEGAIVNYADMAFNAPQSANPTIAIRTDSTIQQMSMNNERIAVSDYLKQWKNAVDTATSSDMSSELLLQTSVYANGIHSYLSDLSFIVNNLSQANSGMSQNTINAFLSAINSALTASNQSISSITSAQSALKDAQSAYDQATSNFNLKIAGSSSQTIAAQSANVAALRAELAKDTVLSPIDGLVTRVDPNVGEFVGGGVTAFAVQSAGTYKIEAYVPEADIAKVALGNKAQVTLDAYGADTYFPATVTSIDPAETVLENVPTYKVTMLFDKPDARIRSGMTANTDIMTHEKDNVLTVPSRAVIDNNGVKSVRMIGSDGKVIVNIPVTIGLKGSDGTTEIISGLNVGNSVITYIKQ